MLIGYARVSTDDQDLSLQEDALVEAGCSRFFKTIWAMHDVALRAEALVSQLVSASGDVLFLPGISSTNQIQQDTPYFSILLRDHFRT